MKNISTHLCSVLVMEYVKRSWIKAITHNTFSQNCTQCTNLTTKKNIHYGKHQYKKSAGRLKYIIVHHKMAGYKTYVVLVSGDSVNQSGADTGGLADAGRICVLGEDWGVDVSADIDGEIGCGGLRGDSTVVCQYTQLETQKQTLPSMTQQSLHYKVISLKSPCPRLPNICKKI